MKIAYLPRNYELLSSYWKLLFLTLLSGVASFGPKRLTHPELDSFRFFGTVVDIGGVRAGCNGHSSN